MRSIYLFAAAIGRAWAVALLVLIAVLLAQSRGHAQADPRTLPLVHKANVQYLGFFTLPNGGPDSIAVDGGKVYAGYSTCVQTLSLPAIGGMATPLAGCAFLPNIDQVHPTDRNVKVGGILPYLGGIVASGYVYYDGAGAARRSHWKGVSLASLAGPFTVSTASSVPAPERPGMVGGGMGIIPPEWRSLLGGPALTGLCCVPIIGRSSFGPSVSVFDPANLDGRPSVPSAMLIGYPIEHKALGEWDASPPGTYYGGTDQLGGIGFPAGTRSILFTGRHGDSWCYGPGTANKALVGTIDPAVSQYPYCYDPTDPYQGNHGPPYRPTMWAYDALDVLAVKAGTKKPWDVRPYEKWTLDGMPIDNVQNLMRAGYFEQATSTFFVAMNDSPRVYMYRITVGAPPPPDVACAEDHGPWGPGAPPDGWNACEDVDGVSKKWRSRTWTTTIAKSGNGAACVWTGNGAVGSTKDETQYVTCEAPPPPPPITMAATLTPKTCTLAMTANKAPDASIGWGVQFSRRRAGAATWTTHGTRDTAAPFGRDAVISYATGDRWEGRAVWTKSGAAAVTVPTTALVTECR